MSSRCRFHPLAALLDRPMSQVPYGRWSFMHDQVNRVVLENSVNISSVSTGSLQPLSWRELLSEISRLSPSQMSLPVVMIDDTVEPLKAWRVQVGKASQTVWIGMTAGSMPVLGRGDPVLRKLKDPMMALTWGGIPRWLSTKRNLDDLAVFVRKSTYLERWYLDFGDVDDPLLVANALGDEKLRKSDQPDSLPSWLLPGISVGDVALRKGDPCLFVNEKRCETI